MHITILHIAWGNAKTETHRIIRIIYVCHALANPALGLKFIVSAVNSVTSYTI